MYKLYAYNLLFLCGIFDRTIADLTHHCEIYETETDNWPSALNTGFGALEVISIYEIRQNAFFGICKI